MSFVAGSHNGKRIFTEVYILNAISYVNHKHSNVAAAFPSGPAFRALVDTGATSTIISRTVAKHLGGRPITQNQYETGIGTTWLFAYLFYIAFKQAADSEVAAGPTTNFTIKVAATPVCGGCIPRDVGFDVLLGMDILTTGKLTVEPRAYRFDYQ